MNGQVSPVGDERRAELERDRTQQRRRPPHALGAKPAVHPGAGECKVQYLR